MDDSPTPPDHIDRAVIVAMRDLVQSALLTGPQSVGEASERAWGYCYARYPWLPARTISQAVDYVLMELQLLPPVPLTMEIGGEEFREVDDTSLAKAISYMIAFDQRGKPHRAWHDGANSMAARHLVQHLRARGFVVLGRTATGQPHSAGEGV